jgi:ABC-type Fe3+-hydroxamate transport system substrate-binding protein
VNPPAPLFIDAQGTRHGPAGLEARIVSLVPSITELLCELGLVDQLVGRTGFCIHPQTSVAQIPKVGGTKDVNIAKIRKLAPTHLIVNIDENEKPTVEALAQFVPHVVVTHPNAPEDNLALYRLLGGIFGRKERAEALCKALQHELDLTQPDQFVPRRALYLIWKDPWMAVAPDTYIARMLARAHCTTLPVSCTVRYPQVALETLETLVTQADTLLLSTEPYRFETSHVAALAAQFPHATVRLIDGEMVSWYGSRAVAGLRYLRGFFA